MQSLGCDEFSEDDYIALLDQVHHRLGRPIILVWDNLNTHVSVRMRALTTGRHWLTVIRLPSYAPDLNPTEGTWSWMKHGLANTAARSRPPRHPGTPTPTHRPTPADLIAGFLAQTGMTVDPEPP